LQATSQGKFSLFLFLLVTLSPCSRRISVGGHHRAHSLRATYSLFAGMFCFTVLMCTAPHLLLPMSLHAQMSPAVALLSPPPRNNRCRLTWRWRRLFGRVTRAQQPIIVYAIHRLGLSTTTGHDSKRAYPCHFHSMGQPCVLSRHTEAKIASCARKWLP
jgi:hypothetical protein